MFISHLYVFFGEMSVHILCSLFEYFICFSGIELNEILEYFGDYSCVICFLSTIFSHSEDCLFTLLIVSLTVKKLLSLIMSHLYIFIFISITVGGGSKKILLWLMLKSVVYIFLKEF